MSSDWSGGWTPINPASWLYASPTSFTWNNTDDMTSMCQKGTKVRYYDTAVSYGVIASSSYAASTTTVNLIPNADYSIADPGGIHVLGTGTFWPGFSYETSPQGWPTWFNWSPTLAGWSANPTNNVYQYRCDGTAIQIVIHQATSGTSNNTVHTATLPVTAATITNMSWDNPADAIDNGTRQTGSLIVVSAGTIVNLNGIIATALSTASGSSRLIGGQVTYRF